MFSKSKIMVRNKDNSVSHLYKPHKIEHYTKITVMRALLMFHKKWIYDYRTQSELFQMQYMYGRQFLIDLFVMSEIYMNHYPMIKMDKLRAEIIYIINQIPDYRLKYESN